MNNIKILFLLPILTNISFSSEENREFIETKTSIYANTKLFSETFLIKEKNYGNELDSIKEKSVMELYYNNFFTEDKCNQLLSSESENNFITYKKPIEVNSSFPWRTKTVESLNPNVLTGVEKFQLSTNTIIYGKLILQDNNNSIIISNKNLCNVTKINGKNEVATRVEDFTVTLLTNKDIVLREKLKLFEALEVLNIQL